MKTATYRPIRRPLTLAVALAVAVPVHLAAAETPLAPTALEVWKHAPITFERNDGQLRPDILFLSRGASGEIAIRPGEITVIPPARSRAARQQEAIPSRNSALRVRLAGANTSSRVDTNDLKAGRSHYFYGNNPAMRWENVPHYGEIVLRDVYTHIDLALHGRQGELEYDFIVAPGADPAHIRLALAADSVSLDADGSLVMQVGDETLRQKAPVAYQQFADERVAVDARFELHATETGTEARFVVGAYDAAQPLVIDPTLAYSTYLGSSGGNYDFSGYLAVDSHGDIYVASNNSPTGSIYDPGIAVNVTKLYMSGGTAGSLAFSTTLAGSGYDVVNSLAIGASGGLFNTGIAGLTTSPDFPHCFRGPDCASHHGGEDAFVTVLGPSGSPIYSQLIGGSGDDAANAIAVGGSGNDFYITGDTQGGWPTTLYAPYPSRVGASGGYDADSFITRINVNDGIRFSTYLGGSGGDVGYSIAVSSWDGFERVGVIGYTTSTNFPLWHAYQSTPSNIFVTRLDMSGATQGYLNYSTYFGANGDSPAAIAIHPVSRETYLIGDTSSPTFPVVYPTQGYAGGRDVFISSFSEAGNALTFSTYLGGSGDDYASDIKVVGNYILATGTTTSTNFPVVAPVQSANGGGSDAFVTRYLNRAVEFSTYLGGSGTDEGITIAAGNLGDVWVAGMTFSSNFPRVNAYRGSMQGPNDLFVSKITFPGVPVTGVTGPAYSDFSGDGKSDILIRDNVDGTVYGWIMNGLTITSGGYLLSAGSGWTPVKVPDTNGDRRADILLQHTDGSLYAWIMNGLTVTGGGYLLGAGSGWTVSHTGDFNGDGKQDILLKHTDGSIYVWLMDGATVLSGTYLQGAGTGWSATHVADFNGDGKSDILLKHTDGSIYIWQMNGIAVQTGTFLMPAGTGWSVTETGDFNGDGKADILLTHTDGGVYEWQMNGTTVTTGTYLLSPGSGWAIHKTGDLNGDGKSDIIIKHTDGTQYAWLMNGLTIAGGDYLLGAGTGWTVSHLLDLNGDGKADILIKHTDGSIYGWIMNGATITSGTYLMGAGNWRVTPP